MSPAYDRNETGHESRARRQHENRHWLPTQAAAPLPVFSSLHEATVEILEAPAYLHDSRGPGRAAYHSSVAELLSSA